MNNANGNHQFDGTGAWQDLAFAFGGIANDKPVDGLQGRIGEEPFVVLFSPALC